MTNLQSLLHKHFFGIQKKILIILSAIFFVLIITLGVICSNYATAAINDEVSLSLRARSQYLANTLNSHITEQKNTLFYFSFDTNFNSVVDANYATEAQKYTLYKGLNTAAKSIVTPKKGCELYVYIPEQNYLYSTDSFNTINNIPDNPLLKEVPPPADTFLSHSFHVTGNFTPPVHAKEPICFAVILTVVAPSQTTAKRNISYISMSSSNDYFDTILQNTSQLNTEDFVVILDENSELIYSNTHLDKDQSTAMLATLQKNEHSSSHSKILGISDKEYLISETVLAEAPWKIVILNDTSRTVARVKQIYLAIAIATISICIFIYISLHFVLKKFISPITQLKQVMKNVADGDFSTYSFLHNNDEIGELSAGFNAMISKINDMINQVYKSRLYQREAELYALQEQINPHFLYNTLGTISSLAGLKRYKEIRHAVTTLANIFRYSISNDSHILACFQDELLFAQRYMTIQELRFEEKVSITFDVEPVLNGLYTLKLIFQPLIENSISHGMPADERPLHIVVICKLIEDESHIQVQIKNDGNQISKENLLKIQQNLSNALSAVTNVITSHQTHSIGIYNVNSRIKLLFGNDYGLTIDSNEQETVSTLTLPIIHEEDLTVYEQQENSPH